VLALILAAAAVMQPAGPPARCHVYVVVHRVNVDASGRITRVEVATVIDPSAPGTPEEVANHPVQMELPAEYLLAVRARLERQPHAASQPSFSTYTFYNPARPNSAEVGPGECG
jgi:hypothetical protein